MPNDNRIVILNESSLKNIANSIRNKTKTTKVMYPSEMSALIDNIKVGGGVELKKYNIKITQKPNQTINVRCRPSSTNETNKSQSYEMTEICRYDYEVMVTANAGYRPGEITVMKNGIESPTSGLLDGDLEVSISDATTDLTIDLQRRYADKSSLSEKDIAEIINPNLIAKDDASEAFSGVQETNIPKIMINTSNVTSMENMFRDCKNLTSLDLSNFDTSNVQTMIDVFKNCTSLKSLDLSNFDTSKANMMVGMFDGCTSLETLDLSNFDTSKAATFNMFSNCENLKFIILNNKEVKFKIRDFDMLQLNYTCKFLVPKDSIEKYKNTPEWSNYKDRIEPIERYVIERGNGKVSIVDEKSPEPPVVHISND